MSAPAIFRLVVFLTVACLVPATAQPGPQALHMRLVGHVDMNSGGEGMAMKIAPGGRWILYVAHEAPPKCFMVVDVTNPANPKVIEDTDAPLPTISCNSLDVSGDILVVAAETPKEGEPGGGIRVYGLADPLHPKLLSYFDLSGPYARPHRDRRLGFSREAPRQRRPFLHERRPQRPCASARARSLVVSGTTRERSGTGARSDPAGRGLAAKCAAPQPRRLPQPPRSRIHRGRRRRDRNPRHPRYPPSQARLDRHLPLAGVHAHGLPALFAQAARRKRRSDGRSLLRRRPSHQPMGRQRRDQAAPHLGRPVRGRYGGIVQERRTIRRAQHLRRQTLRPDL